MKNSESVCWFKRRLGGRLGFELSEDDDDESGRICWIFRTKITRKGRSKMVVVGKRKFST